MSSKYKPRKVEDFRKIDDTDINEFNQLVDSFVSSRQELKNNIKAQKGEVMERKAKIEEETKPITEAISSLKAELAQKPTYYSIFQKHINSPSLGSTEVRMTRRGNETIFKLGSQGLVDEAQIQDGVIDVINSRTNERMVKKLTPDLAQLLFVPFNSINADEIQPSQLVQYYKIMQHAGFVRGSNNNKKLKWAREWNEYNSQLYNLRNQQAAAAQPAANIPPAGNPPAGNPPAGNASPPAGNPPAGNAPPPPYRGTNPPRSADDEGQYEMERKEYFSKMTSLGGRRKTTEDKMRAQQDENRKLRNQQINESRQRRRMPREEEPDAEEIYINQLFSGEQEDERGPNIVNPSLIPPRSRRPRVPTAKVKKSVLKGFSGKEKLRSRQKPSAIRKSATVGRRDRRNNEDAAYTERESRAAIPANAPARGMERFEELLELPVNLSGQRQTYHTDLLNSRRVRRRISGTGFMNLDDIVSRLHLLASSMEGGNISSQATNEMADIIDMLQTQGVLAAKDVKHLYDKYIHF